MTKQNQLNRKVLTLTMTRQFPYRKKKLLYRSKRWIFCESWLRSLCTAFRHCLLCVFDMLPDTSDHRQCWSCCLCHTRKPLCHCVTHVPVIYLIAKQFEETNYLSLEFSRTSITSVYSRFLVFIALYQLTQNMYLLVPISIFLNAKYCAD